MKRLFDLLVALAGLAIASPIMLAIAILIKLESRGPIFYSCQRIGRDWKPFGMLKFRTMVENADSVDCKLCVSGDVRVTALGRFLRRTKLNELPQIFNVLVGDMSVVGPRPEDLEFTQYYKEMWDAVLSVRPGIVGPNQIANRNEEDLFPESEDPARFYLEHILPEKLERDVQYVKNQTLWRDILLLCQGIYVTLFKGFSLRSILDHPQVLKQLLLDSGLSVTAYLLANILRYEAIRQDLCVLVNAIVIISVSPLLFYSLGLYNCSVRFFSVPDVIQVLKVSGVAGAFLVLANYFIMVGGGHSRTVFVLYPMILAGLLCSKRIIDRIVWERGELKQRGALSVKRVVVYGAGRRGAEAVKRLQFETGQNVVGLLDDDPQKRHSGVFGCKVLGTGLDLSFLKSLYDIDRVVIAFSSYRAEELTRICSLIRNAGIDDILIQPTGLESHEESPKLNGQLRQVSFSDVLGLRRIPISHESTHNGLQGATVAVFGAGDELGLQLCRELIAQKVGRIVVIEDCEARLEKLTGFLHPLTPKVVPCVPIFLPPSTPWLVQEQLSRLNTKRIIYNPFNRPFAEALSCFPIQAFLSIVDAAHVIEAAKNLRCESFTFLSPLLRDGFSPAHRQLHRLVENYVRFTARENSSPTRFITVRPANVLENENEIFLKACALHSSGKPVERHPQTVHVTTADNAARVVMNSLFLDYEAVRGSTLIDCSGLICDLKALIDHFLLFRGIGASPQEHGSLQDARQCGKEMVDGGPNSAEMIAPGLLKRTDNGRLDADEMRKIRDFAVSACHDYDYPTIEEFLKGLSSMRNEIGSGPIPQGAFPVPSNRVSEKSGTTIAPEQTALESIAEELQQLLMKEGGQFPK